MNIVSPSILASNFARLGEEAAAMEQAGADWLHVDVMDGHFVPNITIGAPVAAAVKPCTGLPLDVHLMISDPAAFIPAFAKAGAAIYNFHIEAEGNPLDTIRKIRAAGMLPALTLKPATPAEAVFPYLGELYMVLVMTVEPGFGGQGFLPAMLPKIRAIREECRRRGLSPNIEVDGGITDATAPEAVAAGADVLVAGSYIFRAPDRAAAIRMLRGA